MCMCIVHSLVELVRFVFAIPGVTAFLSNRLCQDPLENFFGQQRQRGRVNEISMCHSSSRIHQHLRIVNGICCDAVKVKAENVLYSWIKRTSVHLSQSKSAITSDVKTM